MVEVLKKVLKFIWAFLTVPYHEGEHKNDAYRIFRIISRGL